MQGPPDRFDGLNMTPLGCKGYLRHAYMQGPPDRFDGLNMTPLGCKGYFKKICLHAGPSPQVRWDMALG